MEDSKEEDGSWKPCTPPTNANHKRKMKSSSSRDSSQSSSPTRIRLQNEHKERNESNSGAASSNSGRNLKAKRSEEAEAAVVNDAENVNGANVVDDEDSDSVVGMPALVSADHQSSSSSHSDDTFPEIPVLDHASSSSSSSEDAADEEADSDMEIAPSSSDEDDDEDNEDGDNNDDPILWHTPGDPRELTAPLPSFPLMQSLPVIAQWREFGLFPSAAHMHQKVCGHRNVLERFGLYATLKRHNGCVNALNFNPSGTMLASGSDDLQVCIWDWARKKLHLAFSSGHRENVFQTKFMPLSNDSLIVTASRDGYVRLAELSQAGGTPKTKVIGRHSDSCHKIDVRPDAQHFLLSCGEDGLVQFVDIRESRSHKLVSVQEKNRRVPLYSIMSNPLRATEFLVSGRCKYVRLFDLRKLETSYKKCQPVLSLCPPVLTDRTVSLSVSSAVYNYDGSEILASYNDFNIFLFANLTKDEKAACVPIGQYEGHRNNQTVKGVNFYGPKSEFVVSGSDCGRVFFWDKKTCRVVHHLRADDIGAVNVLEPHPYVPVFATSGLEHDVKVWAPTEDGPVKDLEDLIKAMDRNSNERKREIRSRRSGDTDHFFMMLMEHLARRNRTAAQNGAGENGQEESSGSDDDENNNADAEADGGREGPARWQRCDMN